MAFLAAAGPLLTAATPYIAAASTALSVAGAVRQGQQAKVQGQIQARELREDANARQAEAQRDAIVRRRQGNFSASRARAVAAASGAGLEGTPELLIDRIQTQSDLNVLNALYEGDATARGLRSGARTAQREGKAAARSGIYKAAGSAISGATSFYDKYGGGFKSSAPSIDDDLDLGTAASDFDRGAVTARYA